MILEKLEAFAPIHNFKFGHTRTQIEFFMTSSQQGSEKFCYWQHVLQLRALYLSLLELYSQLLDADVGGRKWWKLESSASFVRRKKKAGIKGKQILLSIEEKKQEAEHHLDVLRTKYAHLDGITEEDILKEDATYWAMRLGKQLAVSRLSRVLGINEGEMSAVLSLPKEQQAQVLNAMHEVLNGAAPLLQPKTEKID